MSWAHFKEFSDFTRGDRIAIFCLSVLLLAGGAFIFLSPENNSFPVGEEKSDSIPPVKSVRRETASADTVRTRKPRTYTDNSRTYINNRERRRTATPLPKRDESIFPKKYAEGTVIDLNRADTTELRKIPGIGMVLSRRIVAFRDLLGGFTDTLQLHEVYGLPTGMGRWFTVTTPPYRLIEINKADTATLARHPYINWKQARRIMDYRHRHGPIKDLRQLSLCEEFTEADFVRLKPYMAY